MRTVAMLVWLATILPFAGCRSAGEPSWGASATLRPPPRRASRALWHAAIEPEVLVPATGALLLALTDWDEDVADWAREETPIFHSTRSAARWSDGLLATTGALTVATAVSTPGGANRADTFRQKAKGLAVEGGAVATSGGVALLLKETTSRVRPDGSDDLSFPSAHTTMASALAALNGRNAEWLPVSSAAREGLSATGTGLALLTGWARIEAGLHHPSDVLAGYALGRVTALAFHDTFLGRGGGWQTRLGWQRASRAFTIAWKKDF